MANKPELKNLSLSELRELAGEIDSIIPKREKAESDDFRSAVFELAKANGFIIENLKFKKRKRNERSKNA